MIVVLTPTEPPCLVDLDRLDRLHAELHGTLDRADLGELCAPDDDEHVWLHIARAREIGVTASTDPAFGDQFDGMIGYATSKGWLDDDGTHVRAHIEPAS